MLKVKNLKRKVSETTEQVDQFAEKANKKVAELAGEKVDAIASDFQGSINDFLGSLRRAAHAGSNQLRKDGYSIPASMIEQVSGKTYDAEEAVDELNPAHLAHTVQGQLRTNPFLIFGSLAVAGFVAAAVMQRNATDE